MKGTAEKPETTLPETWAGKKLRERDQSLEHMMRLSLANPLISDEQRATALEAFAAADWFQRAHMHMAVDRYLVGVKNGSRQLRQGARPLAQVLLTQAEQGPQERSLPAVVPVEVALEVAAAPVALPDAVADEVVAMTEEEVIAEQQAMTENLFWSGQEVPGTGQTIEVERRGQFRAAKVTGYFHAEGFLGVTAEFEGRVPAGLRKTPRHTCFFGCQVRNLAA